MQAFDSIGSTSCSLAKGEVDGLKALLIAVHTGWFQSPALTFPAHLSNGCRISAHTNKYRVFLEVASIENDVLSGYSKVELSPIETSHSIVDTLAVQRVEDNSFGVSLLSRAHLLLTAAAYPPEEAILAVLLGAEVMPDVLTEETKTSLREDTTTYWSHTVIAHTDILLLTLVLGSYQNTGKVPTTQDIESAYRIEDILKTNDPQVFTLLLSAFAAGETSSDILVRLKDCTDASSIVACSKSK